MSKISHKANNSAAGTAAQERRTGVRFPFSASVEATHLQADNRLHGRVSDLGRGGCYIDTLNPFPVGAEVKLRIAKGNVSFVAEGRVLYAAAGMGMGLAFTKIEAERILVLEGWLRELNGDSPFEVKPLAEDSDEGIERRAGSDTKYVLSDLIVTLIRKRVLTDAEGKTLLQKLMQ